MRRRLAGASLESSSCQGPATAGRGGVVQAVANGPVGSLEGLLVTAELPQRVGKDAHRIQLEGQLLGLDVGAQVTTLLSAAHAGDNCVHPALLLLGDPIMHRT